MSNTQDPKSFEELVENAKDIITRLGQSDINTIWIGSFQLAWNELIECL